MNVGFPDVAFAVLTDRTGGASDAKSSLAFQLKDISQKSDVRALFDGQGAPPAVAPADPASPPPRVLYGFAEVNEPAGTFNFGRAAGPAAGDPATAVSAILAAAEGVPSYVAWRNTGDGRPMLALQAAMALDVATSEPAPVSRFPGSRGVLWRVPGADGMVRFAAALEPLDDLKGFEVATRFGSFTAAALPPTLPHPRVPRRLVPAVRVAGAGAKPAGRALKQFAATLALKHAAIALDQADGTISEAFTSLDFDEEECLFHCRRAARASLEWSPEAGIRSAAGGGSRPSRASAGTGLRGAPVHQPCTLGGAPTARSRRAVLSFPRLGAGA